MNAHTEDLVGGKVEGNFLKKVVKELEKIGQRGFVDIKLSERAKGGSYSQ